MQPETNVADGAKHLVLMLKQLSHDPDAPGREAIPAWRTEAAEHGDVKLCACMDSYEESLLVALWDGVAMGEMCPVCGRRDPWEQSEVACDSCAQWRGELLQ